MLAYLDHQPNQKPNSPAIAGDATATGTNTGTETDPSITTASSDFGGIILAVPAAVLNPKASVDVASFIRFATSNTPRLTVAPRGNGHSVWGQASAKDGLVLNMRTLDPKMELVSLPNNQFHADVSGGALWEEILDWSVTNHNMAPVSWTDYLGLTVGGTLSNGGVSGQTYRYGPQVMNVVQMEVVTGEGECYMCSKFELPDLFYAVLGGLGQFGVIIRARIPLQPAPRMVRWIRLVYSKFEEYKSDAERVVNKTSPFDFDYVEGFAFVNSVDPVNGWPTVPVRPGSTFDSSLVPAESGPVLYCLEVAVNYDYDHWSEDKLNERVNEMLGKLKYIRGLEFRDDVSYVDFLLRVKHVEREARANGSWTTPHPWLNLFVSASDITDFDMNVFKRIIPNGIGGPMLVYPMIRSKWDPQMSVALPKNEIFYLVALLRFPKPYPQGPPLEEILAQNRQIVECCRSNGYDFKLYLPHYETEADWAEHFSDGWPRFVERKAKYDPTAVLAPGQKIFSRSL